MAKRVYFAFHYQDVIDFRANAASISYHRDRRANHGHKRPVTCFWRGRGWLLRGIGDKRWQGDLPNKEEREQVRKQHGGKTPTPVK